MCKSVSTSDVRYKINVSTLCVCDRQFFCHFTIDASKVAPNCTIPDPERNLGFDTLHGLK